MAQWKQGLKIFLVLLSMVATGCMVGPDFKTPKPPATKNDYTYNPLPKKTTATPLAGKAGKSQKFLIGRELIPQWWTLLDSKEINQLVLQGLDHNPTLDAALATLNQAKSMYRSQFGALLLPSVTGEFNAQRQRYSASSGQTNTSSLFNLYNASVSVSYYLDVFGGLRRQVEVYRAAVDYQRYQYIAAYLTLTSNIVTTAITGASLEAQIRATTNLLKEEEKQLEILQNQFKLGAIPKQNVLTQETQVGNTRALIPKLQKNLDQSKDALAVLVGCAPSQIRLPKIDLDKLNLPEIIPVTLPSILVCRRPDVKSAEAQLHEASAQIGVATANLLPQFPLSATYGYESMNLNNLFQSKNLAWNYAGGIMQTLFKGGSLFAARQAAIDGYNAAFFQYQQTVLNAFQNVADALSAVAWDAHILKAETDAEIAAKENLILITEQFNLGAVNYLALLIAEQQYQQALINRIQGQADRYNDTIALFIALGGSWWVPSIYPAPIAHKLDAMV